MGRDVTIIPDNATAITAVPATFTSVSPNRHSEARRTASTSMRIVNGRAIFQRISVRFSVIQIDAKVIGTPRLVGAGNDR